MSDAFGNQEIVAAILTTAVLRSNAKPHAKIAVETYRNVLDTLRAEFRHAAPSPAPAPEPAPAESVEAAAEP